MYCNVNAAKGRKGILAKKEQPLDDRNKKKLKKKSMMAALVFKLLFWEVREVKNEKMGLSEMVDSRVPASLPTGKLQPGALSRKWRSNPHFTLTS